MNLRAKLLAGFSVTTGLALVLGALGLTATISFSSKMDEVHKVQEDNTTATNTLNEHFEWRQEVTEAIITGAEFKGYLNPEDCAFGDLKKNSDMISKMSDDKLEILAAIDIAHNAAHSAAIYIFQMRETESNEYVIQHLETELFPNLNEAVNLMMDLESAYIATVASLIAETEELSAMLTVLVVIFVVVALAACIFTALLIAANITKPMVTLTGILKKAGDTGDVRLKGEDEAAIGKYSRRKDEIGQCISSAAKFIRNVIQVSDELEQVANGDLTLDIHKVSENDVIGVSLSHMVENLNNMFAEVGQSTGQVSSGAKQIADGSQLLAQGSTEQAASVQELSASINEIAGKTKENAKMAEHAAALAGSIMQNAEKGSHQMDDMMKAVNEINEASNSIGKVIKTIDDIAFQTNILALNAAVEAARAGQHGKGFAVVAEEVRNLAAKSADAAKETNEMIQNSMEKAELGSRIARETSESLTEIVSGITESGALISDIARSSEEQSAGIVQINTGIDQVAQVVQQNSATAQQSAAASQQMSAQSSVLQDLVAQFRLKKVSTGGLPPHADAVNRRLEAPDTHQQPSSKKGTPAIVWTDEWNTGNEKIDSQHKQLIKAISDLMDACSSGQGRTVLDSTMSFLVDYTAKHFGDEEELQQQYKYPDIAAHKKMHTAFKKTVADIKKELETDGASIALVAKVNKSIAGWLINHIKTQDTKVAAHIRGGN